MWRAWQLLMPLYYSICIINLMLAVACIHIRVESGLGHLRHLGHESIGSDRLWNIQILHWTSHTQFILTRVLAIIKLANGNVLLIALYAFIACIYIHINFMTRFAKTHIFENSDFCIMVFCIPKVFFCSNIKSVIQIGLELCTWLSSKNSNPSAIKNTPV